MEDGPCTKTNAELANEAAGYKQIALDARDAEKLLRAANAKLQEENAALRRGLAVALLTNNDWRDRFDAEVARVGCLRVEAAKLAPVAVVEHTRAELLGAADAEAAPAAP